MDLDSATHDLRAHLGDFLGGNRPDGVFHVQTGGPGSVPALTDLDTPELHLDLLPETPTDDQQATLRRLGYIGNGPHWTHPGGWRLIISDHGSGWRAEQAALQGVLCHDPHAARAYRAAFTAGGRDHADHALRSAALAHHARTVGLTPARQVARLLAPLDAPWMIAAGVALDLHLGVTARPHDDLDVILPRETQARLPDLLRGWRLDASIHGTYRPYAAPLDPPHFQIHARHPDLSGVLMLDLMLSDLSGGLWHYRRDPRITLPLERARCVSPEGLPYLAPEAVLLFKAGSAARPPRGKDEQDYQRVQPTLTAPARAWLRGALTLTSPGHPWLTGLE
ncbi:nucleotidyltransferase domain-containing protein [Deinococcus sp.]|uniref:nucleotidyltransferase domain-containing protein n=1 Tax=Deinococcus sp. TaxID=47478 RepID=UPI0039195D5E